MISVLFLFLRLFFQPIWQYFFHPAPCFGLLTLQELDIFMNLGHVSFYFFPLWQSFDVIMLFFPCFSCDV